MVSDEELLRQVATGNTGSLEALIHRYHKPIYVYLQRMLGDPVLAEDLTQDCFIRVCNAVNTGRLPAQFQPWLYRIATNLCKDVWKSAVYRKEDLTDCDELSLHSDHESVSSILDRQWERETVIRALEQLKPEEKQMMILRFYQDLKIHEISEIVEQPLSTVKSRMYQTYKKLAQYIKREEEANYGKPRKTSGQRSSV